MQCKDKKWQRVEKMGKEEDRVKEEEVADSPMNPRAQLNAFLLLPPSVPPPMGQKGTCPEAS